MHSLARLSGAVALKLRHVGRLHQRNVSAVVLPDTWGKVRGQHQKDELSAECTTLFKFCLDNKPFRISTTGGLLLSVECCRPILNKCTV